MTITEYGKVIRDLRKDVRVSLRQMAQEIGFSATYLSAVEIGEKQVTEDLVDKVSGFLRKRGKKARDLAKLHAAVDRTRRAVDVSELNGESRQAVAVFARKLADLDAAARERFLKQLEIPLEEK
jgi:transcriptional regulator with XRE-family HTH domain